MATKGRPNVKLIIAANVAALMKHHKQDAPAAAKHLKMQPFQLKRILAGQHHARVDTLQRIADGYNVEPYQLLMLNLNPKNPQVPRVLTPEEERLYRALEAAMKVLPPLAAQ
jgi:hypothetical protein